MFTTLLLPDSFSSVGSGFTKASTATSSSLNQFTTSASASGFVTASTASTGGSKYTGNFGGPPGVLAPNGVAKPSGFATASTFTQNYNTQSTNRPLIATTTAAGSNSKFTGSFGGPPGVLRPYDNVKSV